MERRGVQERVPGAEGARDLAGEAPSAEAAALGAQDVRRLGGVRRGRDEVDRAAEGGGAEAQRVAARVDFHGAHRQRVDLVEVAAAVGEVPRDAVLQELHPAQVEAAADAGAAHGKPQFLPVAGLHEDARRVGQHVAEIEGAAVPERLGGNETDGSRCPLQGAALLLDTRHGEGAGALADDFERRQGWRRVARSARLSARRSNAANAKPRLGGKAAVRRMGIGLS